METCHHLTKTKCGRIIPACKMVDNLFVCQICGKYSTDGREMLKYYNRVNKHKQEFIDSSMESVGSILKQMDFIGSV